MKKNTSHNETSPIYIFSGGRGLPANSIMQSILAQFPDNKIPVQIIPDVLDEERLAECLNEVLITGGIIVHTMVDRRMRERLIKLCNENDIREFDLMGNLFDYLESLLKRDPVNEPGLFRKMNKEYFDENTIHI